MRPWITINCAVSADGRMAGPDGKQTTLSSPEDFARVHAMRAASGAILVGIGTILTDNPKLTVSQKWHPLGPGEKNPLRIVLDPDGRTPPDALVLNDAAPTWIVTSGKASANPAWTNGRANVKHLACPVPGTGRIDLAWLCREIGKAGIPSLMVEGGARVIRSFLLDGLFDEFCLYTAPVILGGGPSLAMGDDGTRINLCLASWKMMGDGILSIFVPATPKAH